MKKSEYQIWQKIAEETRKEREDFPTFACRFYERFHKRKLQWNWHLQLICQKYLQAVKLQKDTPISMRKVKIVIFNVPPRSGKTEFILKLIPLWLAGHNEQIKYINTSYSASMVQSTAKEAREYWNSREFKATFPWRSELDSSKKAGAWGTKKGLQYYATGSGGSITGFGADIFGIDDPSKPDEIARTGNELENINAWFGNTVFSRLNPDGLKLIFVIMQRLDDNDLCGYLLSEFENEFNSGEFWHISIPAIATEKSVYRNKGESFFPERFSISDLKQKMRIMNASKGAHYFSAQYQQEPLDIENAEFRRENFKYSLNQEEYLIGEKWAGVDIALSEKASSDWRSIVVVQKTNKGRFYVHYNYYSRSNSNEVLDKLFTIQKKFECNILIEANGAQKYFANTIRKNMEVTGQYFYLKEVTTRGDKNARMRSTLLPLYENNRVIHATELQGGEMEKEILRFPKSKHDDNMDALETAISAFPNFGTEKKAEQVYNEWDNNPLFGGTQKTEQEKIRNMFFKKPEEDTTGTEYWDQMGF